MTVWRNRIVGYSDEAPDQLLANPQNWRTHPGTQADALRGVLGDVGIVQNVIANRRTGYLVDGHLRVMEALKAGQPSIPVTWVDLSPEEEALVLATLDPLSAMAGTDTAQLDALLRDVSTDSPAVAAMLDALAQEAGIVLPDVPEPAPQMEPQLRAECLVEIYCTREALDVMRATLDEWAERRDVTINIQE